MDFPFPQHFSGVYPSELHYTRVCVCGYGQMSLGAARRAIKGKRALYIRADERLRANESRDGETIGKVRYPMSDISTPCILSEIRQMFQLALFQNLKIRILILKFAENPQKQCLNGRNMHFGKIVQQKKAMLRIRTSAPESRKCLKSEHDDPLTFS